MAQLGEIEAVAAPADDQVGILLRVFPRGAQQPGRNSIDLELQPAVLQVGPNQRGDLFFVAVDKAWVKADVNGPALCSL